ncbi:MAG: penicillin-binding protein 2 [bacterium JZ-2024 1]
MSSLFPFNRFLWGSTFLAFATIGVRAAFLQIVAGERYAQVARGRYEKIVRVVAPRGIIRDRRNLPLATNEPTFEIQWVGPRDPDPDRPVFEFLKQEWFLSRDEVISRIQSGAYPAYSPVPLIRKVSPAEAMFLLTHPEAYPEVSIELREARKYPYGKAFSHVLGYIGEVSARDLEEDEAGILAPGDTVGRSGLEATYDAELRGKPGWVTARFSQAQGRWVYTERVSAVAGADIITTLDARFQTAAATLFEGRTGALVAVIPETGEILALVSSPSFDPNLFLPRAPSAERLALLQDPARPLFNRAISAGYPPASTIKPFLAAYALSAGIAKTQTAVSCGGVYRVGNREFKCWKAGGHGGVALRRAIADSCDVFFYALGVRMGASRLSAAYRSFGFGERTGADLPGERAPEVPDPAWKRARYHSAWYPGDSANMAIGQGFAMVTVAQMARAVSALANGGTLPVLHLRKHLPPPQGKLTGLSPQALKEAVEGMREAVTSGTATACYLPEVYVAAKTGTAQIPGRRDYSWAISFARLPGGTVAIAVIVEEGGFGAESALPIACSLYRSALSWTW